LGAIVLELVSSNANLYYGVNSDGDGDGATDEHKRVREPWDGSSGNRSPTINLVLVRTTTPHVLNRMLERLTSALERWTDT
jgi:hypothetical protein